MTTTDTRPAVTVTTPDVRIGDRITVNPGALSAHTYRPLSRPFSIEVTHVRREHDGRLYVEGFKLTAAGKLSEAQTGTSREAEIGGAEGGEWSWFGLEPRHLTREHLATELGAAYGVDQGDALGVVEAYAGDLVRRHADRERYGYAAEWQMTRGEPTALGAHLIREQFAQAFAELVSAAASVAVRRGYLHTVQPGATLTAEAEDGRRYYLHVREHLTYVHGVFPGGATRSESLLSDTYPNGIVVDFEADQLARGHLRDDAAEALFLSLLDPSQDPTDFEVLRAISETMRRLGCDGCAACVAEEFGNHPETAARRMTWCRDRVARL